MRLKFSRAWGLRDLRLDLVCCRRDRLIVLSRLHSRENIGCEFLLIDLLSGLGTGKCEFIG